MTNPARTPEEQLNLRLKKTALVLGWMLIAGGALWALGRLGAAVGYFLSALSPFLIALIFAYIFNPIVNVVQRRFRLGRVGGIVVVALLLLLFVGLFLGVLAPIVYEQSIDVARAIGQNLPVLVEKTAGRLGFQNPSEMKASLAEYLSGLGGQLKRAISENAGAMGKITSGGATAFGTVAKGIGTVFTGALGALATSILVLVIAFYCLAEFDAIPRLLRLVIPSRHEKRTMEILKKMDEAVGGFLRGQLIACSIIGVLAAIGLAAIGLRQYAILIGVVAGLGNFIPYLGPVLGATPAILWAFLSPVHTTWGSRFLYAGLVVAIFVTVQMVDGLFSQPRIVGKSSHLHPLVVMAALVLGAQLGITGMILAVPVASAARVLFLELWWNDHVARKREAWAAENLS